MSGILSVGRAGDRGFTYIGLLVMVAVMGVVLATVGQVWHAVQKREREKELLFVGDQFRQAITRFNARTPARARPFPTSLEELLKDPRFPGMERHLRKIYADPMTGGTNWGLVKGPAGEIYGVYSLSGEEPVKQGNFSLADRNFEGRKKYAEWVFMYAPGQARKAPAGRQ